MEKKKYNLRSARTETVQIPIQVQLSDDSEFLNLLDNTSVAQQDSDVSYNSDSDLDLSAVVGGSDSDDMSTQGRSFDRLQAENPSTSAAVSDQTFVNQQILAQLSAIGTRLEKLEQDKVNKKSKHVKTASRGARGKTKSTTAKSPHTHVHSTGTLTTPSTGTATETLNLPTLENLKKNVSIQQLVEDRIKELQQISKTGTDPKLKSQRGGQVEVLVKNRIKWPHEYVLAGSNKERVTYDRLTMGQWVAGFCRTMRDESDTNCKEAMLSYLISLLDDANDFSWSAAKACNAVLLCRMEQGEIKDFTQTEAIDRVRRAHAQRHVAQSSQIYNKNASRRDKNLKSMPCQFFNQGTCTHNSTHETRGVLYRHICSSCFTRNGKTFPHSEAECKNKQKATKNE